MDDFSVKSTDGVTYTPVVNDHLAGYKATFDDGRPSEYVYLVASTDSDDGVPTVFVYHGTEGDPNMDAPEMHFVMGEGD